MHRWANVWSQLVICVLIESPSFSFNLIQHIEIYGDIFKKVFVKKSNRVKTKASVIIKELALAYRHALHKTSALKKF